MTVLFSQFWLVNYAVRWNLLYLLALLEGLHRRGVMWWQ